MERKVPWASHLFKNNRKGVQKVAPYRRLIDKPIIENTTVSMDFALPNDLVERIIARLPTASIFRAGSVCKTWKEIVSSRSYKWNLTDGSSQAPWYFMFTSSDEPFGYAYDFALRKWYSIELPCIDTSNWFIASSYGLVCFMDNDNRSRLFVCNPIAKEYKALVEPPGVKFSDYIALAISVDRNSHSYTVTIVKSKQVPDDFVEWDLSIQVYDSETRAWVTATTEVLSQWRGGDESVICDGILYFLIYSTGGGGGDGPGVRHGLITYNLYTPPSHGSLMHTFIPAPCALTCGRLMNLKDKLVMVGGIRKHNHTDIITGIGIWTLNGKEWEEISRMPHRLFQGFGEFDDVFASSGTDNLIYVQSYGSTALLSFDMNLKRWKWSQKCPVTKRFPLQLFTGFCFEPRLEVIP